MALSTQETSKKLTVAEYFNQRGVTERFNKMLGDKSQAFITSVLQVVASNELLKNATPESIYHAAATAASMDLPVNPNLGFSYIVPYRDKSGQQIAQFQVGYKGFIQLAQRTGLYERIAMTEVYEGQLIKNDPLEGCVFDWENKISEVVLGYVAYFRLRNGFIAMYFMSKDDVESHAKKYSKSYSYNSSVWKQDFDSMAKKTVLKLLLSKYAPLSIDMQNAIMADQGEITDSGIKYVDNPHPEVIEVKAGDKSQERALMLINDCQSIDELSEIEKQLGTSFAGPIEAKRSSLIINSKGVENVQ